MVDKLFIMLPEFRVKDNYDLKAAWNAFYADPSNSDIVAEIDKNLGEGFEYYMKKHPEADLEDVDDFKAALQEQGIKRYQFSEKAQERFSKWFKENKKAFYQKTSLEKTEYDFNKKPQEQSRAARNNGMIDLMWGVLTSPDSASQILTPGGFVKQKMADRVVTILDSLSEEELNKEGYTIEELLAAAEDPNNLKALTKIASRAKKPFNPLSPRTQVMIQQQNMTGADLISIYAIHNAAHAYLQHTEASVSMEQSFYLGGRKELSLHSIRDRKGKLISSNTSNYLAASVDNVKDNTLFGTNQNKFTAGTTMLLSRLGYNPIEIALLMRQPIVMKMTKEIAREARSGKSRTTIVEEVIKKTAQWAGMHSDLNWDNVKDHKFEFKELAQALLDHNTEKGTTKDYFRRQVTIGLLFQQIMKVSGALEDLTSIMRADGVKAAAGPTIADTIARLDKVNAFNFKAESEKFPLRGVGGLVRTTEDANFTYTGDKDALREYLLKGGIAPHNAFFTLGVEFTERLLGPYFPQYSRGFRQVVSILSGLTKSGNLSAKTINDIYNNLFVYITSGTEFFGAGKNRLGADISSTEKRRDFINNFPSYFNKIVSENPDIADLEFIKRLKTVRANDKSPVDILVFKNVGQLRPTLRERYTRDWATLLHMKNPVANQLAYNLFLYCYYRNGFSFGPSTFIHLAPTALRKSIPNYVATLRELEDRSREEIMAGKSKESPANVIYEAFIDQYLMNHLYDRQFTPELPADFSVKIADDKGTPVESFQISIEDNSTYSDKRVVLDSIKMEGVTYYSFVPYIAKKIGKKTVYYRLSETDGVNTAEYTRVEPLGYRYNFLEYEFGKSATEIETVIDKNKKDYDPQAALAAKHIDEGLSEAQLATMPKTEDAYSDDAIAQSFKRVYGREMTQGVSEDPTDITKYKPNNVKDANDDEICGGATLIAVL